MSRYVCSFPLDSCVTLPKFGTFFLFQESLKSRSMLNALIIDGKNSQLDEIRPFPLFIDVQDGSNKMCFYTIEFYIGDLCYYFLSASCVT